LLYQYYLFIIIIESNYQFQVKYLVDLGNKKVKYALEDCKTG